VAAIDKVMLGKDTTNYLHVMMMLFARDCLLFPEMANIDLGYLKVE
jgi:hypothetical protein